MIWLVKNFDVKLLYNNELTNHIGSNSNAIDILFDIKYNYGIYNLNLLSLLK